MYEPLICYPIRNETRPLVLDMDVGLDFIKHKVVVYAGSRTGVFQRPYAIVKERPKQWPLSKGVARIITEPASREIVWHINRNSFDCRRSNLVNLSRVEYAHRLHARGLQSTPFNLTSTKE